MIDSTQMVRISMAVMAGMPTPCTLLHDTTALYLEQRGTNSSLSLHLFSDIQINHIGKLYKYDVINIYAFRNALPNTMYKIPLVEKLKIMSSPTTDRSVGSIYK